MTKKSKICYIENTDGELAQLARASALQAEGQGFEPPILHKALLFFSSAFFYALEESLFFSVILLKNLKNSKKK